MTDREKVINGLEHELQNRGKCGHYCREGIETFSCNYDKDGLCIQHWGKDALALLKAQEPRVLTLEEIPYAVFGWMEMFGQLIPCVLEDVYADDTVGFANLDDGHDYICASDYNKTWRCWTSRPTDEQREAVKWE